jgi:hypothetical protein
MAMCYADAQALAAAAAPVGPSHDNLFRLVALRTSTNRRIRVRSTSTCALPNRPHSLAINAGTELNGSLSDSGGVSSIEVLEGPGVGPIVLHDHPGHTRRVANKTIRLRDKEHCKHVAAQPCLICGRAPSEAHHIRFAQPRALSRKVSDEYTVPVCRLHHRELHRYGDEASWWAGVGVDPLPVALELWKLSRSSHG